MSPLIQDLKAIQDIFFPGVRTTLALSKQNIGFEKNTILVWINKPLVNAEKAKEDPKGDRIKQQKLAEKMRKKREADSISKSIRQQRPILNRKSRNTITNQFPLPQLNTTPEQTND